MVSHIGKIWKICTVRSTRKCLPEQGHKFLHVVCEPWNTLFVAHASTWTLSLWRSLPCRSATSSTTRCNQPKLEPVLICISAPPHPSVKCWPWEHFYIIYSFMGGWNSTIVEVTSNLSHSMTLIWGSMSHVKLVTNRYSTKSEASPPASFSILFFFFAGSSRWMCWQAVPQQRTEVGKNSLQEVIFCHLRRNAHGNERWAGNKGTFAFNASIAWHASRNEMRGYFLPRQSKHLAAAGLGRGLTAFCASSQLELPVTR